MIDTQLHRQCLEVLHVKTVMEFVSISAKFGQSMGFHTMAAMIVTDHSLNLTEFQTVTNAPIAYMPAFEDLDSAKLDPVLQHCKRSSLPITWDQRAYVDAGHEDFWEHQAAFGLRSGVGVAFHLPRGKHFVFGLTSDQRTCGARNALLGLTLDVQLFASYAQAAAFDLCSPYAGGNDETVLASSEIDALRRSMDGLTNWEVGEAMGISEKEVLLRLSRAMAKLGCANRYEAALRAIRLGLIDCS